MWTYGQPICRNMSDFESFADDSKKEIEERDLTNKKTTQRLMEDSDGEEEEEEAKHSESGGGNDNDTDHLDRGTSSNFTRKQLRLMIVEQFLKNVPQRKIAKTLNVPPSTVHNIIKRFRDRGEISEQETQGRKSLLNAGDVQILKEHCIKNRPNSLLEITAWAQEHFQKFVSVNAVRRAMQKEKLKLLHGQKKSSLDQRLFNETRNIPDFSESEAKLSVEEFKYLEPKKEFTDSDGEKEDENTTDQDRLVTPPQGLTDAEEQDKDAERSGCSDADQDIFTWRALQEAQEHSGGDFRRKSIFEFDESSELQSGHMTNQDNENDHLDRGASTNFTRKQLRQIIVEQFLKNVSQRKIAKTLSIPPSTVHNIIKRFRERGEISEQETQGRKPLLNAGDLQILKEHCIKNRPNSVLEITAWAQEHFQKFVSVNAVRRAMQKERLKLLHGQKKSSLDQHLFNETKNVSDFAKNEAKLSVEEFKEKYLEAKKEFTHSDGDKEDENTADQDRLVTPPQGLTDTEEQDKDAGCSGSSETDQEMFTWRALQEAQEHSGGDFRRKSIFEFDESSELQSGHMTHQDNENDHLDRGASTNFTRKQLRLIIVEQFQRNVSQRKIAKTLNIPPSTVHNIIKRFRDTGEISEQETQGRKPLLNSADLQILKEHCVKNRPNSVLEITAWAQEHFQKFVSVNAVRRAMQKEKLKLLHGQKKSSLDKHLFNETRNIPDFSEREAKLSVEEFKYLEPKKEFTDSDGEKEGENTADQDRLVTPPQGLTDAEEQDKDTERSGSSETDQDMFIWRALKEAQEHSGGDFDAEEGSMQHMRFVRKSPEVHMTNQDNENDHLEREASTNFTRKQLRQIIVEQFLKNVSQRKIAKSLNIPHSTVHNIIKKFRETGEISEQEAQGRKSLLNAGELQILKEHCFKNRHNSLLEITAWAQEHFKKSVSVKTVQRAMQKCKIKLFHVNKSGFGGL